MPVVGANFSLICTVTREDTSLITWIGPNGPIQTSQELLIITESSGYSTIESYLNFHPLLASHRAVYTCNSFVNTSAEGRNISDSLLLDVQSK